MMTGISPSEYLRWSKLSKAVFELKYTTASILDIALKYGYESQEGFTRTFKNIFGITPGDYRRSDKTMESENWNVNKMIHDESHEQAEKGNWTKQNVDSWIVKKPARIWAAQREYDPAENGLEWNYGEAPIVESDNGEFGYTMWFPAKKTVNAENKYRYDIHADVIAL